MARQAELRLTAQGRAKLNRILKRSLTSSRFALYEGSEKIVQPNVAKRAPTLDEERRLLSIGLISKPYRGPAAETRTGFAGYHDERRFWKGSAQRPVQVAILAEKVRVYLRKGLLKVYLGKTSLYNPGRAKPSIGFSWHGGGEDRSTDDPAAGEIWRHLLESWEYGGSTFTVTPRTTRFLEPERWGPGRAHVLAEAMTKTIPPFGMFSKGGQISREPLRKHIEGKVKKMIRAEFGR